MNSVILQTNSTKCNCIFTTVRVHCSGRERRVYFRCVGLPRSAAIMKLNKPRPITRVQLSSSRVHSQSHDRVVSYRPSSVADYIALNSEPNQREISHRFNQFRCTRRRSGVKLPQSITVDRQTVSQWISDPRTDAWLSQLRPMNSQRYDPTIDQISINR